MLWVDSHKPFKLFSWCLISPSNALTDFFSTSASVCVEQQWPLQISPVKTARKRNKISLKFDIKLENQKKVSSSQPFINYLNSSIPNDLRMWRKKKKKKRKLFDFSLSCPWRATYGTWGRDSQRIKWSMFLCWGRLGQVFTFFAQFWELLLRFIFLWPFERLICGANLARGCVTRNNSFLYLEHFPFTELFTYF